MKEIILNTKNIVLVDDTDYFFLCTYTWYEHKGKITNYARTSVKNSSPIYMHQLLLKDTPEGYTIDHKDRNGLNNQRNNLRFATFAQQAANTIRINKLGYRGVYLCNLTSRYRVRIKFNGRDVNIGRFDSIKEAALAYNQKALELYGEFATLNELN